MELLAKKYAKAVLSRADSDVFYELLQSMLPAFENEKFIMFLNSCEIKKDDKAQFILSFFEDANVSFRNFIKLLVQNSRIDLIPDIFMELKRQKSLQRNECLGFIFSQKAIEADKISDLEKKLGNKFNASIKLENKLVQDQGIKISLQELGYEISFSMQSLENKMSDYILKTI